MGVPHEGHWYELLSSNAELYGGTDEGNFGGRFTEKIATHGYDHSAAAGPAAAGDSRI